MYEICIVEFWVGMNIVTERLKLALESDENERHAFCIFDNVVRIFFGFTSMSSIFGMSSVMPKLQLCSFSISLCVCRESIATYGQNLHTKQRWIFAFLHRSIIIHHNFQPIHRTPCHAPVHILLGPAASMSLFHPPSISIAMSCLLQCLFSS